MGKPFVDQSNVAEARRVQKLLADDGIDPQKIEAWINQPGAIDKILSDNKLLQQYFKVAQRGLDEIAGWVFEDRFQARPTEVPEPGKYLAYFGSHRDTSGGRPYVDILPEAFFENIDQSVKNGYLSPRQGKSLAHLMKHGMFRKGFFPNTAQGSAAASTGSTNKAMAAGGMGGPKTYGTQGPKTLGGGALPPPPGGFPPPPPASGGTGGGYGPEGWDPASGNFMSQSSWDYLNNMDQGVEKGILGGLFESQNQFNGLMGHLLMQGQDKQDMRRRLIDVMNNLDMSTPEGRHQMAVLGQEMSLLQDTIREDMDTMVRLQRAQNERKTLFKGILDVIAKTKESLIRNLRAT